MPDLPKIGERESQRLEFKAAELLRTPAGRRKLLRAIAGMLNAGGGQLLVGLREQDGALAGLDPLTDDDRKHEGSLRDALLDAIEPRIEPNECDLAWLPAPGGSVLEIRVHPRQPPQHPPFCMRDGDSRIYLKRVGDRLRVMTYAELQAGHPDQLAEQESWFTKACEEAAGWFADAAKRPSFLLVLGLQPLDGRKELRLPENAPELLNRPPDPIARPDGWSFVTAFPGTGKWARGGKELASGYDEQGYRQIRANHAGLFAFRTLLEHLQWDIPENWRRQRPDAAGMLYPYALVETTVSLLRLAAELWKEHLHDADLHAHLQMTHTKGWLLPHCGPHNLAYLHLDHWHKIDANTITSGPHRMPAESFRERADAFAHALLTDVYAEFDYDPKHIPCFDPATGSFQPPRH